MRSLSDTGRSSKAFSRNILRLVGPIEVIWIAIWGFAFAKAIRKYGRSRGFIGEPQNHAHAITHWESKQVFFDQTFPGSQSHTQRFSSVRTGRRFALCSWRSAPIFLRVPRVRSPRRLGLPEGAGLQATTHGVSLRRHWNLGQRRRNGTMVPYHLIRRTKPKPNRSLLLTRRPPSDGTSGQGHT